MNDAFVAGLRSWHDFFMLTGTAAATLIGLVFVAVSLGGNTGRASMRVMQTFVSPIVKHFGYVLLFAAIVLVPTQRPLTLALAIFIVALFALIEALAVLRGLVAHHRAGSTGPGQMGMELRGAARRLARGPLGGDRGLPRRLVGA